MRTCRKDWNGVVCVLCAFLFFSCGVKTSDESTVSDVVPSTVTVSGQVYYARHLLKDRKWIIHAGGLMANEAGQVFSYTNSKEALENCYEQGNVISELDFRISSDDCLVCTHEWTMMYKDGVALPDRPVSKDDFLGCRTYGGFTSMWLGDLVSFLEEHNEFYFITDCKDDNVKFCRLLADFCPEWRDHFIIQIYHAEEYEPIRSLGFQNIIYTLYASRSEEERGVERLVQFAKDNEIVGYTYWHYWTGLYLETFLSERIDSYVHTVNDYRERNAFLDAGVSAIYTDVVGN